MEGFTGTIVPECFVDHPQMVEVSWSVVLEAVEELEDFIRAQLELKSTHSQSPHVVLAEVGMKIKEILGEKK